MPEKRWLLLYDTMEGVRDTMLSTSKGMPAAYLSRPFVLGKETAVLICIGASNTQGFWETPVINICLRNRDSLPQDPPVKDFKVVPYSHGLERAVSEEIVLEAGEYIFLASIEPARNSDRIVQANLQIIVGWNED